MKQNSGSKYARNFFKKQNSGNYDYLVHFATLGMDSKWKEHILRYVRPNSYVLELACGTGILSKLLLKGDNNVLGLDLTFSYLQVLKEKGIDLEVVNATAESVPFQDCQFDCIVTSYLPKYTNIQTLMNESNRLLKNGGLIILHDFTLPTNRLYRISWNLYFKMIRLIWYKDKKWKNVFDELDSLIRNSNWDIEALEQLKSLKFTQINRKLLTFETSAIITATKS